MQPCEQQHLLAVWQPRSGIAVHNVKCGGIAAPFEFGLGTRYPRFVVWALELGLETQNARFVAGPLEMGLETVDLRFVACRLWLE